MTAASVAVATTWTADVRDPGQDHRQGDRHLHPRQQLPIPHAHATGRLDEVGVHLAHPDRRIGDDRGDRERREGDDRGKGSEAQPERQQHQEGDPQQAERGHRAPDPRDRRHGAHATAGVADPQPDRQGDRDRDGQRHRRDPDVLEEPRQDPVPPGPGGRIGEPGRHLREEALHQAARSLAQGVSAR